MASLLSILLLALSLALPAYAAGYDVEVSNINADSPKNNPSEMRLLTMKSDVDPLLVEKVTTYHWNNGLGTDKAGSISIVEYTQQNGEWKELRVCGTWAATGRSYWGIDNVYWDAYPNFVMQPGHAYIVKPSDKSTWSYNETSKNQGMFELYGNYQKNAATGNPSSGITNDFDHGYKCSAWAEDEVKQADFIGIFPDSLRHVDLTQPITRAEFAAVSVNTYVRMSKRMVEPYSPNPFTDTNDTDILRAYAAQLTGGTGGTNFSPDMNLTREMGATMLARAYKKTIYPDYTLATDSQYPLSYSRPAFFADDAEISEYAYQSVNFMFQNNIIGGVGGNKFGPKSNMTREAALAIAVRMIDNLEVVS